MNLLAVATLLSVSAGLGLANTPTATERLMDVKIHSADTFSGRAPLEMFHQKIAKPPVQTATDCPWCFPPVCDMSLINCKIDWWNYDNCVARCYQTPIGGTQQFAVWTPKPTPMKVSDDCPWCFIPTCNISLPSCDAEWWRYADCLSRCNQAPIGGPQQFVQVPHRRLWDRAEVASLKRQYLTL